MLTDSYPRMRAGVVMGATAILLWSVSAVCIVGMGKRLGAWQFLAITPALAGLFQIVCYRAMGRSLRSILFPPPKLWLAIALGFVAYLFFYATALVTSSSHAQTIGVNLMNYLWPALTVVFTTWLVPGVRLRGRLAGALALSLAGVMLATGRDIAWPGAGISARPYVLGGLAAISWAAYCALTSRWRQWAQDYACPPVGFLLTSALAAGVCLWRREWEPLGVRTWCGVIVTAIGPWGGGYLLWELALHRVPGTTLGLFGSVTPVLSTVCLMGLFALIGGVQVDRAQSVVLLAASVLIGAAVVLGAVTPKEH